VFVVLLTNNYVNSLQERMESSVTFASLESQKKEIAQLMQTSIDVESVWYVVAESTFEKRKCYCVYRYCRCFFLARCYLPWKFTDNWRM